MRNVTAAGFTRISKPAARREFNAGHTVYLLPCRVAPGNAWIVPAGYEKAPDGGRGFEALVNYYTAYNCGAELGSYPAYYIKTEAN